VAGPGGAWLRLDPTPPSPGIEESGVGEEAFDLARTAWDEYVLGMESEPTENTHVISGPLVHFLKHLDVDKWEGRIESIGKMGGKPFFRYLYGGLFLLVVLLVWLRSVLLANPKRNKAKANKVGRFRKAREQRIQARLVSIIG